MKKLLILSCIVSLLGYSKNIPVNIGVNLSNGYERINVSKNDLKVAGLESISEGEFNQDGLFTTLGLDIKYPINLEKLNISVGGGLDIYVENNLSSKSLEAKQIKLPKDLELLNTFFTEKEDEIEKEEEKIQTYRQAKVIATNVANSYDILNKELTRENIRNQNKLKKIKEAIATLVGKTPQEAHEEYKQKSEEAFKRADTFKDEENKLSVKIIELVGKLLIEENEEKQNELSEQIKDAEARKAEAHDGWVNALRERRENDEKAELFDKTDEKIAKLEKQIQENVKKKHEYSVEEGKYNAKKVEYRRLENSSLDRKTELINEILEKSKELYSEDMDELLTKKVKEDIKENEIYDKDIKTEEEIDNEVETKYRELISEDLKSRKDDQFLYLTEEEAKEFIAKRNEEYPLDINYDAKVRYNELINKQVNFGGSIYGLFEVNKEMLSDFSVFGNLRAGLRLNNNPLYFIANTFESEKVEVDGIAYIKPEGLSPVKLKGFVQIGAGIKYKGFTTEIYGGYNHGIAGLRIGYEF
ncbi:coiled-coil domain-containing protein [Streptobacillus canis]|uniref:hypothetical protein n=1 Tax=Streptobacillus canis TaxID=2678686 RepID=UPI0012E0D971|nr:hypothetical protein [Streptobacillus canis]